MATYLGTPTSRVDGRAKVTGAAKYAAEFNTPGLAYGALVTSSIAKGRVTRIDTSEALRVHGVIDVLTHEHRPRMAGTSRAYKDDVAPGGSPYRPLYDDKILFSGQPVALVLAEDWESARSPPRSYGSSTLKRHTRPTLHAQRDKAKATKTEAKSRGSVRQGLRGRRRAARGGVFRSDRASQSDGAVWRDRDLGRRRQAHGL